MSFNDYRNPIIWEMRDVYIPITQEIPIDDYGRVTLDEVPDDFNSVIVTSTGKTWYEIKDGIPNDSQYKVDYNGNTIQFAVANKGLVVTIEYFGRGNKFIPANSIYTSQNNGQVVQTLQEIVDSGQTAIENLQQVQTVIDESKQATQSAINQTTIMEELETDLTTLETNLLNSEDIRVQQENIRQQQETDRQTNTQMVIDSANNKITDIETRMTIIEDEYTVTLKPDIVQATTNAENKITDVESRMSTIETEYTTTLKPDIQQTITDGESKITDVESRMSTIETEYNNTLKPDITQTTQEAQTLIDNTGYTESWSSTTTYMKNNIVSLNGSSFISLQNDNLNNQPDIVNLNDTLFWGVLSKRGVDGTGAVSSVNSIAPDVNGNVTLSPSDIGAIPTTEKGVANGVALLNADGKVVDSSGNLVEGKVTSVNGEIGDVVIDTFSGNYSDLTNKPTSTVANIDDAVTKRHSHTNITSLDKLGVDTNNKLTINGTIYGSEQVNVIEPKLPSNTANKYPNGISIFSDSVSFGNAIEWLNDIGYDISESLTIHVETMISSFGLFTCNQRLIINHSSNGVLDVYFRSTNSNFSSWSPWKKVVDRNEIGVLTTLTTTDKSNLVNSVNEVNTNKTQIYTGDTAPTTPVQGMFWLDTSTPI